MFFDPRVGAALALLLQFSPAWCSLGGELDAPRGPGLVSVAVPGRQMNKNSPLWRSHRPLFWEAGPPLPASRDAAPRHAEVSGWSPLAQLAELAGLPSAVAHPCEAAGPPAVSGDLVQRGTRALRPHTVPF